MAPDKRLILAAGQDFELAGQCPRQRRNIARRQQRRQRK
jgi:hypothetical protein